MRERLLGERQDGQGHPARHAGEARRAPALQGRQQDLFLPYQRSQYLQVEVSVKWRTLVAVAASLLLLLPLAFVVGLVLSGQRGSHTPDAPEVSPVLAPDERRKLLSYGRLCQTPNDCDPPLGCLSPITGGRSICLDSNCMTDLQCQESFTCKTVQPLGGSPLLRRCVLEGSYRRESFASNTRTRRRMSARQDSSATATAAGPASRSSPRIVQRDSSVGRDKMAPPVIPPAKAGPAQRDSTASAMARVPRCVRRLGGPTVTSARVPKTSAASR